MYANNNARIVHLLFALKPINNINSVYKRGQNAQEVNVQVYSNRYDVEEDSIDKRNQTKSESEHSRTLVRKRHTFTYMANVHVHSPATRGTRAL